MSSALSRVATSSPKERPESSRVPAVLQIGGGPWSAAFLTSARRAGYFTVMSDRQELPIGHETADLLVRIDGADVASLEAFVSNLGKNREIQWVNIAGEFGIDALCAIANIEAVTALRPFSAAPFTDKAVFRRCAMLAELRQPVNLVLRETGAILSALQQWKLPFVLKPIRGSGHQGVHLVVTERDRRKLIEYMREQGHRGESDGLIIEELIRGIEYNVYGFVNENEFSVHSVLRKKTAKNGSNPRWVASYVEQSLENSVGGTLAAEIFALASAMGYHRGFMGCSLIASSGGSVILEAAPMVGIDHLLLADKHVLNCLFAPEVDQLPRIGLGSQRGMERALFLSPDRSSIEESLSSWLGEGGGQAQIIQMPSTESSAASSHSAPGGNSGVTTLVVASAPDIAQLEQLEVAIHGMLG